MENSIENINITPAAIDYIKGVYDDKQIPAEYALRINAEGAQGGIFNYSLGFDPEKKDDDLELDFEKFKVLISSESLENLRGTEIDYVVDRNNRPGLAFHNPKQSSGCGGNCGCGSGGC
ncbi:MAG: HesB/IscA family protein [Rhodothermaceae bacterium]